MPASRKSITINQHELHYAEVFNRMVNIRMNLNGMTKDEAFTAVSKSHPWSYRCFLRVNSTKKPAARTLSLQRVHQSPSTDRTLAGQRIYQPSNSIKG